MGLREQQEQRETVESAPLGDLGKGTRQRAELRARIADIAWTALAVVLALWGIWAAVGVARGTTAWVYCAVAWLLCAVACGTRVAAMRRRARV